MSSQEQIQLVPIDTCLHPKLASWRDIFTQAHCYQCMGCGKEINIPIETVTLDAAFTESGIVGLAFGEKWREKLQAPGEMGRRWPDEVRLLPRNTNEGRYFPKRRSESKEGR